MPEIEANGLHLSYDIQGDGEPFLFICGTSQKAATWNLSLRPIVTGAGFKTITFDNRGIPPSSCPEPPWSVADMADDTIGLIEALDIGPCHIMGVSLGAMIVQTVALKRPDLVRSAVMLVGGGNVSRQGALQMRGMGEVTRLGIELPADLRSLMMLMTFLPPAQMADDAMVDMIVPMVLGENPWGPGGEYGQFAADAGWADADHLEELAGMKRPCLFIAGEFDHVFPPKNVKQAAAKARGEYFEIAGSAHVTFNPAQAEVGTKAMLDFLARHRGAPRS